MLKQAESDSELIWAVDGVYLLVKKIVYVGCTVILSIIT